MAAKAIGKTVAIQATVPKVATQAYREV